MHVAGKVVLHDQHILNDWFLINAHSHLNLNVVKVHQAERLSADDRFQPGYLWSGINESTYSAIVYTPHHPLHHSRPPELLLQ